MYQPPVVHHTRLRLLFVGDVMVHRPQVSAARSKGGMYDFRPQFAAAAFLLKNADLRIANFETVLGGVRNDAGYTGYPRFNTPDTLLDALKEVGFDLLLLAEQPCKRPGAGRVETHKKGDEK